MVPRRPARERGAEGSARGIGSIGAHGHRLGSPAEAFALRPETVQPMAGPLMAVKIVPAGYRQIASSHAKTARNVQPAFPGVVVDRVCRVPIWRKLPVGLLQHDGAVKSLQGRLFRA